MKTVTELKQDRAALIAEAEALLDAADGGDRAMSQEEQAKYDAAVARVEAMNGDIERRMKLEAAAAPTFGDARQPVARMLQPSGEPDDEEIDAPQAVIRGTDAGPRIEIPRSYGKLVAFPKTAKGQMQAYRSGMWLNATLYGNMNTQK